MRRAFPATFASWFSSIRNPKPTMKRIEEMNFDNLALRSVPVDESRDYSQRQVAGAVFSLVAPTALERPELVAAAEDAMALLDLGPEQLRRADFPEFFSGNKHIPGSQPAAHCYCGHQFGYFSGQLGDGATMYLGEVVNAAGERQELQFKGAGRTPYSRSADGRKVLRSSIREFLCSEAMHHLGVPTTRAGCCVTSQSTVIRDIFYDGHARPERCTVVLRIAPTFIRFGSFEIFKDTDAVTGRAGPSAGQTELLRTLTDYVVRTFYPALWALPAAERAPGLLREAGRRTALLAARWQAVGWCHGVLNTDNMSILGLTIDYGPFGFMDGFDPDFICNGSDDGGRYTYRRQPEMCRWNLERLADALRPLLPADLQDDPADPAVTTFDTTFRQEHLRLFREKLGLRRELDTDESLVERLLEVMAATRADFTNTFLVLARLEPPGCPGYERSLGEVETELVAQSGSLEEMRQAARPRVNPGMLDMLAQLAENAPEMVSALGGSLAQVQRELANRDRLRRLKDLGVEQLEAAHRGHWRSFLQEYGGRLGQEGAGSDDVTALGRARRELMGRVNPVFVLRNHVAEEAIRAAEAGDFSLVRDTLRRLRTPYSAPARDDVTGADCRADVACVKPPAWSHSLKVT